MSARSAIASILALTFASSAAAAHPLKTVQVQGTAHIGLATRSILFWFSCATDRGKINNLSTGIDVPDTPKLESVFNFRALEGPTADSGKVHLVATSGGSTTSMRFGSTGSFGTNGAPDTTFTFSAGMVPRERVDFQRLQAVVATLGSGPAHLSATIANPRRGPAIEASADLNELQATELRNAMAPCAAPH
ncbi:MAG: hypothetical protein J0H14_10170 [Alphaproteobacteria bacterium]|nr:hypothetical protein [Alphaproteobacteria bacterium]